MEILVLIMIVAGHIKKHLIKLSATYIQGRIVQLPGQMPGSHQEGCLPSEHSWFIVISPQCPKPHLEDGDCVVADHVGPGE